MVTDANTNLANELIDHINQDAVPLEAAMSKLDESNMKSVFNAIDGHHDPTIAESMEAQLKSNKASRP